MLAPKVPFTQAGKPSNYVAPPAAPAPPSIRDIIQALPEEERYATLLANFEALPISIKNAPAGFSAVADEFRLLIRAYGRAHALRQRAAVPPREGRKW